MGLDEPLLYEDDETLARTLLGDADFERLWRDGWTRLDYPTPFVPFTDGFPTPSGKLEFHSERAAADGHDPLPGYVAAGAHRRRAAVADRARLALVPEHDVRQQARPDEARRRAADRAAPSRTRSSAGSRPATRRACSTPAAPSSPTVVISDRVRPGVIASTKGHWLKNVRGGANVNATVEERDADMGGGAIFHDNRVEVERVREEGDAGQAVIAGAITRSPVE